MQFAHEKIAFMFTNGRLLLKFMLMSGWPWLSPLCLFHWKKQQADLHISYTQQVQSTKSKDDDGNYDSRGANKTLRKVTNKSIAEALGKIWWSLANLVNVPLIWMGDPWPFMHEGSTLGTRQVKKQKNGSQWPFAGDKPSLICGWKHTAHEV